MLKADFHLHAGEDKEDRIRYSAKDLVRLASKKGYEILSFTFHNQFFYTKEIRDFAKYKNILLIPGTELTIEKKHVLVNGINELPNIKNLQDLEKIKDYVITAPHPFFPSRNALGNLAEKYIKLFDNVEFTARYHPIINFNKRAIKLAKKYNKPLLGNSDAHSFNYFGYTHTLVDCNKTVDSVLDALKKKKFSCQKIPLPLKWLAIAGVKNVYHEYFLDKRASDRI